ncbi:peptide deformylase [Candidatus Woesearchaeota archaeon]|nr:peptide deformylase [Candidatus Woesearchaeota archaeon]
MIKDVIKKGSPILRKKNVPVTNFAEIQTIIEDLNDTIDYLKTTHEYKRGIGLAAPQIGKNVQITVAESAQGKRYVLINPKIVETSNVKKPIKEGCISFLQYRAFVNRYDWVKVQAYNEKGEEYTVEGKDNFAMLLQHEIDHLNGILYFDHLPNKEMDLVPVEDFPSVERSNIKN